MFDVLFYFSQDVSHTPRKLVQKQSKTFLIRYNPFKKATSLPKVVIIIKQVHIQEKPGLVQEAHLIKGKIIPQKLANFDPKDTIARQVFLIKYRISD